MLRKSYASKQNEDEQKIKENAGHASISLNEEPQMFIPREYQDSESDCEFEMAQNEYLQQVI